MDRRDTIVIGASAGGVEALPRIISQLPKSLAASVLVVQHMAPIGKPMLAQIIERTSEIPVVWAEQGARIEHGRVYVAPPGAHMLIVDDHLQLAVGPRENHVRPSIDRMFRSAAALRGNRTIGVLLTGMLDDGVAGLRAIQSAGGLAIVQDPRDAAYPDLPTNALHALDPDLLLGVDAIGAALSGLVDVEAPQISPSRQLAFEARIDRGGRAEPGELDELGSRVSQSCPDCDGPLWAIAGATPVRYRCYVGHAATAVTLLASQDVKLEGALWGAIRALHDRAATYETLARESRIDQTRVSYAQKAAEARDQLEVMRSFMQTLLARPAAP